MFIESILFEKGLRSNKIWTHKLLFREPFRRIPFYLDTQALLRSQYWSHKKIKKFGFERFSKIVQHASTIPFWKEQFAKTKIKPSTFCEEDIARIPLTSKKNFLDKEITSYTNQESLAQSTRHSTSGTTGKPFNFYHDGQFELRLAAIYERMFRTVGNGERFPVVVMRAVPHTNLAFEKHTFFCVKGYNDTRHKIFALNKVLSSLPKKAIVFTFGSSLHALVRAKLESLAPLPFLCIISTAEKLDDAQRKEMEETLQTKVYNQYSMGETRQIAFECEHHRLHINEEVIYCEITDDHGIPLPPKTKGHIVVTGFENYVMPFIRYDTGDVGTINEDVCPCGRTLRTIEFEGRQMELLNVGDGRTVSVLNITVHFNRHYDAIHQFQVVRTGECSFIIHIVPGPHFESVKAKLTEELTACIHPRVQIQWDIVDSIPDGPNGKSLYFIDKFKNL